MLLFILASLGRPAYYIGMCCFHQLLGCKLEVMVIREQDSISCSSLMSLGMAAYLFVWTNAEKASSKHGSPIM